MSTVPTPAVEPGQVWLEPPVTTRFTTDRMLLMQQDEERDDDGNLIAPAQVIVRFASTVEFPVIDGGRVVGTAQVVVQGYDTTLTPHDALRYFEEGAEAAREAIASMDDQGDPREAVASSGLAYASSMADAKTVADRLEQATTAPQPIIPRGR